MKFKAGDQAEETFRYSQKDVDRFIELTGDANPVHHDKEYAAGTMFRKPIIHGFLSASVFSKILGITMPGYGTIYLNQNMSFKKPMFVDQDYTCRVIIRSIKGSVFELETRIFDSDGEVCIDGTAVVMNKDVVKDQTEAIG